MDIVQNIKLQIKVYNHHDVSFENKEKIDEFKKIVLSDFETIKSPSLKIAVFVLSDIFLCFCYTKIDGLKIVFDVPLEKKDIRTQLDEFMREIGEEIRNYFEGNSISTDEAKMLIKWYSTNISSNQKSKKFDPIVKVNKCGIFYTLYRGNDLTLAKEYLDINMFIKILSSKFKNGLLQVISEIKENKINSNRNKFDENDDSEE